MCTSPSWLLPFCFGAGRDSQSCLLPSPQSGAWCLGLLLFQFKTPSPPPTCILAGAVCSNLMAPCPPVQQALQCMVHAALHREERNGRLLTHLRDLLNSQTAGRCLSNTKKSCRDSWTLLCQSDTHRNWQRDKMHSLAVGFISLSVTSSYGDRHLSQSHRLPSARNCQAERDKRSG